MNFNIEDYKGIYAMNFNIEDYKGKYAMHCKTENEAEIFCKYLHSIGHKWNSGDSYLLEKCWNDYEEATCYEFNKDCYCSKRYFKEKGYTILEMEDFIEEKNKKMNYVDSIFKILNIKPNEPFILYNGGIKFLAKISPKLRIYRYIGKHASIRGDNSDEWTLYELVNIRSILLGNAIIEKNISEEDKKVIEYWKRAGFHYLAKDKDGTVTAYFHKPIRIERGEYWCVDENVTNDSDILFYAPTYAKCDFLSWEDDAPYCLD